MLDFKNEKNKQSNSCRLNVMNYDMIVIGAYVLNGKHHHQQSNNRIIGKMLQFEKKEIEKIDWDK